MVVQNYIGALELGGVFFSLSFGILMTILRFGMDETTSTKSQRWTLSILAWLFFINTMVFGWEIHITDDFLQPQGIHDDVNILVPFLVMAMGIIYPRPRAKPSRLRIYLLLLAALGMSCSLAMIHGHVARVSGDAWALSYGIITGVGYLIGWFLPIFIWLPDYEVEGSAQMRMILGLLIWGFFTYLLLQTVYDVLDAFSSTPSFWIQLDPIMVVRCVLTFIVMGRLVIHLARRLGHWEAPEKLTAGFLVVLIPLATVLAMINHWYGPDPNGLHSLRAWLGTEMAWVLVRPALFIAAFLRYQIVTPSIKGISLDRALAFFATIPGMFFVAAIVIAIGGTSAPVLAAAVAMAALAWYPMFRFLERGIERFLPATKPSEELARQELRTVYFITLQTAIYEGRIHDDEDERAIEKLRGRLGISKREHDLLLSDLASRDATRRRAGTIKNLFLILGDGRLVCHIGTEGGDETDKDLVAGMLTAIRGFVSEGLGGAGELDTVKFGEEVLAIESRGEMVMAASVVGMDLPEMRQRLGDWLAIVDGKYGHVLKDWDGDFSKIKGVDQDLRRFMGLGRGGATA